MKIILLVLLCQHIGHKLCMEKIYHENGCKQVILQLSFSYHQRENQSWYKASLRAIFNLKGVKSNPESRWFCCASLCNWSRKLASLSQPITCKTKTKHELVAHIFPHLSSHRLLTLQLPDQIVILLTVSHTVLIMLVQRI